MTQDDATADQQLAELAERILRLARELDPHSAGGVDVVPLTGTETAVLRWIHRNPGTSPSAAAEATGLKRPNLSAALRGLEHKGLVQRSEDPDDHRHTRLQATDLADQSIARLRAFWAARLRSALADVDQDAGAALDLLDRLDAGLRGGRRS
ncbi:MarR family winged helix-turn-helix transcriptional regulator [Demequina mangrovi]|uniref:DNA-binding transcriptional regulator, MarR family n=1 Tax=Demequina mangrovi TaxID=1043493 RepID=A0A1H6ZXP0_9MICO|nr:MarR family transcriptional regulator [Demequina mangrovi]SEJ56934.1 DNA-binding transcriptional regulator, MarR family [Demequina mangrovi]